MYVAARGGKADPPLLGHGNRVPLLLSCKEENAKMVGTAVTNPQVCFGGLVRGREWPLSQTETSAMDSSLGLLHGRGEGRYAPARTKPTVTV